jgi:uncharacterized protein
MHSGMDSMDRSDEPYVIVPPEALSPSALQSLLEEFVSREGTDYGAREYSLSEKVASVQRQLERGEVVIVFDPETSSATLQTRDALRAQAAP